MERAIRFDQDALCELCGKKGAFDFMGDYICPECLHATTKCKKCMFWKKRSRYTGRCTFNTVLLWHKKKGATSHSIVKRAVVTHANDYCDAFQDKIKK